MGGLYTFVFVALGTAAIFTVLAVMHIRRILSLGTTAKKSVAKKGPEPRKFKSKEPDETGGGWGPAGVGYVLDNLVTGKELKAAPADVRAQFIWQVAVDAISGRGDVSDDDIDTVAAMVCAHAMLETGNLLHFIDRNVFGVNAKAGEPYVEANDNGNLRKFRAYDTWPESVKSYCDLVARLYPDAWSAATLGGEQGAPLYASGLKHGEGGRAYYEADQGLFARNLAAQYAKIYTWYTENEWRRA